MSRIDEIDIERVIESHGFDGFTDDDPQGKERTNCICGETYGEYNEHLSIKLLLLMQPDVRVRRAKAQRKVKKLKAELNIMSYDMAGYKAQTESLARGVEEIRTAIKELDRARAEWLFLTRNRGCGETIEIIRKVLN